MALRDNKRDKINERGAMRKLITITRYDLSMIFKKREIF